MTDLNKDALAKAMTTAVMTMWLKRIGVDGRTPDRDVLERLCSDIITAYRAALPAEGLAARLLEIEAALPASAFPSWGEVSAILREAAATISAPGGLVMVPKEPTKEQTHDPRLKKLFLNMTPEGWAEAYRIMLAAPHQEKAG